MTAAASARRAFWQVRSTVDDSFAAERGTPNSYNQTKWFGPHRRVLAIRSHGADGDEVLVLATDGFSTPGRAFPNPNVRPRSMQQPILSAPPESTVSTPNPPAITPTATTVRSRDKK